jgi:RNA polymerase sigma-70 factor (ECF subfamily)
MAQRLTPEALLALVARRDRGALGELYDRLAPPLYRTVRRILSDRAAAEEVLEVVFAQLWNEARRLREEPASVAAWLAITARAAAVDRLRGGRGLLPLDPAQHARLEKSASWLPSSREIAQLEKRRELLKKVLNQLPVAQRQGLELLVFEGYTETEIAQKVGEPLGRVKTGLRAGLAFLRHRLRAVLGTWAANI